MYKIPQLSCSCEHSFSTFIIHIYCLCLKSLSILPEQKQHIEQFKVITGYHWTKLQVSAMMIHLKTKVNTNNNSYVVSLFTSRKLPWVRP